MAGRSIYMAGGLGDDGSGNVRISAAGLGAKVFAKAWNGGSVDAMIVDVEEDNTQTIINIITDVEVDGKRYVHVKVPSIAAVTIDAKISGNYSSYGTGSGSHRIYMDGAGVTAQKTTGPLSFGGNLVVSTGMGKITDATCGTRSENLCAWYNDGGFKRTWVEALYALSPDVLACGIDPAVACSF